MKKEVLELKEHLETKLRIQLPELMKESVERIAMEPQQLAKKIDHTLLKPEAKEEQYRTLCEEAVHHGFYSVCVPPNRVELAYKKLKETSVHLCTVVGFPLGYQCGKIKGIEAKEGVFHGADEIDMVLNLSALKSKEYAYVFNEIKEIKSMVGENILLKVILETALLDEIEKYAAGWIAKAAGADFLKTSTGFASGGATIEDVRLLKSIAGKNMGVKASGGIKDQETAIEMLRAGATRLGVSSSVAIVSGTKKEPSVHAY